MLSSKLIKCITWEKQEVKTMNPQSFYNNSDIITLKYTDSFDFRTSMKWGKIKSSYLFVCLLWELTAWKMENPLQYCNVISLQLIKINEKKM